MNDFVIKLWLPKFKVGITPCLKRHLWGTKISVPSAAIQVFPVIMSLTLKCFWHTRQSLLSFLSFRDKDIFHCNICVTFLGGVNTTTFSLHEAYPDLHPIAKHFEDTI
jgi:hypothetical protein